MNLETFFEKFELFAEAPNGVQKMRELILQLAVQGKLVPQYPSDEPASVLLEKIQFEKAQLIKNKKIRKSKALPSINTDEKFYKLPINWQWIRLGDIGDWGAGATPDRKISEYYGGTIKWFKSGELNDNYINDSEEKITDLALQKCSLRLNQPGDVLIAMYGATIGKVAILETEATTNQAVCACTCFLGFYNRYLFILLKAYKNHFSSQGAGGAQPNISREKIIHTVAPLPPLAEQHRIVSKVDQLMSLCDELEERQKKKRETRVLLNNVAINQLLTARESDTFANHWQRICNNFDLLYSAPENIGKLRQAILQLAVMGKLVPQDPNDEPASVLLDKIRFEKELLIKEGKIKKIELLTLMKEDDIPFNLPSSWEWSRFGEIIHYIESGWSPLCEKRPKEGKEWGVLKVSAVTWNNFNPNENKALPIGLNPKPEHEVKVGDFLMSRANTSQLVGKSVLVEATPERLLLSDKLLRVIFSTFMDKNFFNFYNNSNYARNFYEKEASGTSTSMRNISRNQIHELPVPIPPFAEQKRIVSKVEQFMNICNELEAKLTQSQSDSEKLINAALQKLLIT
jgi:type I restriction enzyme, S subunit